MFTKIINYIFIITLLLFASCSKNSDIFVPDTGQLNGADTNWVNTITSAMPVADLQNKLNIEPALDSVEIGNNIAILSKPDGLQITFSANCCVNASGQTVTGKIYVRSLLIKKKGDMIQVNKPTESHGRMLVSGGEIFIQLFKNGEDIQLATNAKLQVKYADASPNSLMKLFNGDESNPFQFNWVENKDSATSRVNATQQYYEFFTNKLRWINCDYFYDTAGVSRSIVSAKLPENYTNANTQAFLVFKDLRAVLAMHGNATEKRFISAKVPDGKNAFIIIISKQGNDYFFIKESIVTGSNLIVGTIIQSLNLTPIKSSIENIKSILGTL